jgi:hypothetical protein
VGRLSEELRELTIRQISVIMLIVTFVSPMVAQWHGGHHFGEEWIVDVSIIAVLWVYLPSYWDMNTGAFGIMGGGLHILNPSATVLSLMFTIFNLIFAYQVIRFCKGETSKRSAIIPGVLSLVLPLLMAWQGYSMYVIEFMLGTGSFVYIGPIPIQLIVGLILMRLFGPWEIETPWEEEDKVKQEWWETDESKQIEKQG